MYFVVNKTKTNVTLGDIKISLGPRQAIDLDKVMERKEVDKSRHLRMAVSKGVLEIRVKDSNKKKKNQETVIIEDPVNHDMDEMKKTMEEIKGALNQLAKSSPASPSINVDEIVRKVVENIPASEKTVIINEGQRTREDEEVEMEEETLARLNVKTVDKMVKDTKVKSIEYKEDTQENSIQDNINELEELLG